MRAVNLLPQLSKSGMGPGGTDGGGSAAKPSPTQGDDSIVSHAGLSYAEAAKRLEDAKRINDQYQMTPDQYAKMGEGSDTDGREN